jgi:diadenosine tetraphosphate (Ap4A) HIT family hydrolase
MDITHAAPADLDALAAVEQRARLLARMEGQDPDETYTENHPQLAGITVTHVAWHVFARRLVTLARMLTALKQTEESAKRVDTGT